MSDTSQNDSSTVAPAATETAASAAPARSTTAVAALESAARSAANPVPAPGVTPGVNADGSGKPVATAAIAQPVVTPPAAKPAVPGPVPFPDHDKAVKNAREKGAEEARQKVMAEFAWATGLDPAEAQRALALAKRLHTDPQAFAKQLASELQALDTSMPEPDYRSQDGKEFYSASAMAKIAENIRLGVMREVDGKIQPLMSEREAAEKKAEQQKAMEAATAEGQKVITQSIEHALTLPYFKENQEAISAKLGTIPMEVVNRVGLVGAMYMAFADVLMEQLTKVSGSAESKVMDDLKRKAAASDGQIRPGGPSPLSKGKRPQSTQELAQHMERLAASMA